MELREYQKEIAEKIDECFERDNSERKNFIGVKLPTGGGKTYIFMDQLQKLMEKYNAENPPQNGHTSEISIRYYAPLVDINFQTQKNVLQHVIINQYIENFKNENQISEIKMEDMPKLIDNITDRMLNSAKKSTKLGKEIKSKIEAIYSEKSTQETDSEKLLNYMILEIMEGFSNDIEEIVKSELPNVQFNCYQKNFDVGEYDENVKLVVMDEAHRTGLTWGEKMKGLIEKCPNSKFLAITATPERDVDGIDPMEEFADLCGYSENELRLRKYLASDRSLVESLENDLVVKPKVISFDCKLDETEEYKEVREQLKNIEKKVKEDNERLFQAQRKNPGKQQSKAAISNQREYEKILYNFCMMNKLCGKTDFIKEHLSPENSDLIDILDNPNLLTDRGGKNYTKFERLKVLIDEIDNPATEMYEKYQEEKNKKILSIIKDATDEQEYLLHGKSICFTPRTSTKNGTAKEIMHTYKQMMRRYFGSKDEDVLICHSNKKVFDRENGDGDDKTNFQKFMLDRTEDEPTLVMVAMDKFNEGIHADGVTSLFMCRQLLDNGEKSEDGKKDDPRIIFLQQLGRCIHSRDPKLNAEEEITPVVFDMACNFMRYNKEKLHGIFEISENQTRFKEIYDSCQKEKTKIKPKGFEKVIDIMQALKENDIDISKIKSNITWKEFQKTIPEDKLQKVLDDIYTITQCRIEEQPDYNIGSKIESAKLVFWHEENENPKGIKNKSHGNSATDKFFENYSFESLYYAGFFENLKNPKFFDKLVEEGKIDKRGFIIDSCAGLDKFYGFNIFTGTKYCLEKENQAEQDVNGFKKNGIHAITGIRYDTNFFKFDKETNSWINLYTGKDEDLLGYNHDGIRVNRQKGRVGFDREGMYHKFDEETGAYSQIREEKDENGYDVYGFDGNGRNEYGGIYNEKGFRREVHGGKKFYVHKTGIAYDYDGYDIDGFNDARFNKDGIYRDTSSYYGTNGCMSDGVTVIPLRKIFDDELSEEEKEKALIEWIVISSKYHRNIENQNWYKILARRYDISKEVRKNCEELQECELIESYSLLEENNLLDKEIGTNETTISEKTEEEKELKQAIQKLISVIQNIANEER